MNRMISLGVVLICLPFSITGTAATGDAAAQEIIALEEEWVRAENAKDADALRAILDERMLVVSDSGVKTREAFIAGVVRGEVDPTQSQTLTDRQIVIDGDTAVSTVIDRFKGTRDGEALEFTFRCTTVFVRRDGKWRAIAEVFNKAPAAAEKQ